MTATDLVFLGLALLTAAAAFVDLRTGHIPNRLLLLGLVFGSLLHLLAPLLLRRGYAASWNELLLRAGLDVVLGILACSVAPLFLFKLGAMGGGDVKLLAVVGAATGPLLGLRIEFCAFILVALYAPARLAYEGQLLRMLGNTVALIANPLLKVERRRAVPAALLTSVPFGPAVLAATVVVA